MTTVASQITSLAVVYSIVYSGADERKHQSSASLAFVRGIHRDRWVPRTNGQLRGKCFHLMTSSWKVTKHMQFDRYQASKQTGNQFYYNIILLGLRATLFSLSLPFAKMFNLVVIFCSYDHGILLQNRYFYMLKKTESVFLGPET